jgi:type I restriction enzyme S subunit
MKWQKKKISELCEIKGGKRLPKNHDLVESETNHPYIRARDIGEGIIDFAKPVYLQENTFNLISRYIVKRDDIVLTIVGANIGDVGLIPNELDGANLTENAVKLTEFSDSCFYKYLLYFFSYLEKRKSWNSLRLVLLRGN